MSVAGLLVTVAAVAVGLSVHWNVGAFLLGAVAWFLVATMALSLVADVEVPTSVVVFAVLCWAGSQVLTRARVGYWRSAAVRALARRMAPRHRVEARSSPCSDRAVRQRDRAPRQAGRILA